ncbi:MAG: hypothetical protein ACRDYA_06285 [Egibacteraceae bacterium]
MLGVERHFASVVAEGFDVFLSHNNADSAVVERIAERLQDGGINPGWTGGR